MRGPVDVVAEHSSCRRQDCDHGVRPGNGEARVEHALQQLAALGQRVWLDDLRRQWLIDGTIVRLIEGDAVTGMTSNPSIFEKAITGQRDYDDAVTRLLRAAVPAPQICEQLVIEDIRAAADLLLPVHRSRGGDDGFVSLEISPHLADDAAASVAEGQRLWKLVDRPNLMIKVPATPAGLGVIRALTAAGINVNVTLLFGVADYRAVAEAYWSGLESRQRHTSAPLGSIRSVASFFVSRIDTLVDAKLDAVGLPAATALRGTTAIACARLAYQEYLRGLKTQRWMQLAARGAQPQRLLWASVSTKDRAYRDLKYVEPLIAPDTIVTMPIATLAAFRDHGRPSVGIDDDLENARAVGSRLSPLGIRLDDLARELLTDGVRRFVASHDRLLAALARYAMDITKGGLTRGHP